MHPPHTSGETLRGVLRPVTIPATHKFCGSYGFVVFITFICDMCANPVVSIHALQVPVPLGDIRGWVTVSLFIYRTTSETHASSYNVLPAKVLFLTL